MKENNDDSDSENNKEKSEEKSEEESEEESDEKNEEKEKENKKEQEQEKEKEKEKEEKNIKESDDNNKDKGEKKSEEKNNDKKEEKDNNNEKGNDKEEEKENIEEEDEKNNEEENKQEIENNIPSSSSNGADGESFFKSRIFNKFKLVKKLGEGTFGKVYKAEYNSQYYAIKIEDREEGQDLLQNEATIMSYLKGSPNIPKVRSYGFKGKYNVLVMQLLGKSLEDIFNIRKKFSFKTGAMLAYQMLTVLEYIHERHVIHRDIKPNNFVLGYDELNAYLYLVDFGLAKKYRSSKTLKQYPYNKKRRLTGTARFASIHAMEEMEQSRRDDLESVGYLIMYLIRGNLPWQGLKLKAGEDRYRKILEKKKETSSKELCAEYPLPFFEYVNYSRRLGYEEDPRYDIFKTKFLNFVVNIKKEKFDYVFDWTTENDIKKRKEEFNLTCPPLDYGGGDNILHLDDDINSSDVGFDEDENEENGVNGEGKKRTTKKGTTKKGNKEDNENLEKAETGCCIMQVNILFYFSISIEFNTQIIIIKIFKI